VSTQDRAPSFPFYAKDWLADPKVRSLSWATKGRYIDLLASMWEHGDEGCVIPRDTAERLYGKPFIRDITAGDNPILESYEKDGTALVFSNRLYQEAQKCRSRSAAARKSAEARWGCERNANA
jgi:hypothetical protein